MRLTVKDFGKELGKKRCRELMPLGWKLKKEENWGKGSHKFFWRATKGEHSFTSKYFQNVLVRALSVEEFGLELDASVGPNSQR